MRAQYRADEASAKYFAQVQPAEIREFDVLASASNGVAKIRELLVALAAAGRLFESSMDTPTRKLGEISEFVMGQAPPGAACNMNGQGTIFVKTGEFGQLFPVIREWTTQPLKHARIGDVLICVVGATIGKLNLAIDCAIGRSVAAIRPGPMVDTKYLYFMLMPFTLSLRRGSRGSAQGVIGKVDLAGVVIRLPPLAEQHRIVARVEELMKLCDALEARGRLADAQHARLTSTLFDALAASESAHALAENWQRIAEHFDLLLDRPEAIDALEQTILQLAVRGLLMQQNEDDEPSRELLARIQAYKERLLGEKKAKRSEQLPEIVEYPFDLPESWQWARIGHLAELIDYGTSQKSVDDPAAVPVLRMGNIQRGKVIMSNLKYLLDRQDELPSLLLQPGDMLFNRTNSYELVGKTAIFEGYDRDVTFASYLIRVKVADSLCSPAYVNLYMNTLDCRRLEIEPELTQQNGQANFNGTKLRNIRIPVPPLAEQLRIVIRVEELRRLCAQLRERLKSARRTQSQLAEALVAEVA